ncbi:hypothetical protein [Flavobacterium sp.]|uniref:hypothetical protein n=1 Tax=Flavobacterium sp. TaxID=239 RepID=UPI003751130C
MILKGSKKCVLDLVQSRSFLATINTLTKGTKTVVSEYDNWMPKNIHLQKEAQLKDFLKYNFDPLLSSKIVEWWLHIDTTTPNWDFVSTCNINGKRGILLVEAKAHWSELEKERKEKFYDNSASEPSKLNHKEIGKAIEQANTEINNRISGISISRDNCYQLSNRVAYTWWLANQGIPVVLLYLGFLNCLDMNDGINRLFTNDKEWQDCFIKHAEQVGVDKLINRWVDCEKSEFITICKSL